MSTPTNHWKLGLFVVIGVVLALGAVLYLGAESLRREHVSYQTYFDESVQGLSIGSPIEFRGVKVGQVSEIGIAPDGRHVAVTLALFTGELHDLGLSSGRGSRTRIEVSPDLRVQLVTQGITGLKALQLDFFDPATHPAPTLPFPRPDRYIPATLSTLVGLQASITAAIDRFPEVAEAILLISTRADRMLGQLERAELPAQLAGTLRQANQTLASLQHAVDGAEVGKLSAQTRRTLASLEATLARSDAALARIDGERGLIASARRATDAIGDLATSSPRLAEELETTLVELREAAASFRRLTTALERDPDMLLKGRGAGQ